MQTELTAEQLNKALEGVDAECLDDDLVFAHNAQVWLCDADPSEYGNSNIVSPSHATLIQEASMRNWLEERNGINNLKGWWHDGEYWVQLEKAEGDGWYFVQYSAHTRIEALAQACRAVKGGGA